MANLMRYTDGTVELLAHQLVLAPSETRNFKGKPCKEERNKRMCCVLSTWRVPISNSSLGIRGLTRDTNIGYAFGFEACL